MDCVTHSILDIKIALEDEINGILGTIMKDDLRSWGYLSTSSPYTDILTCQRNLFNTGGASGTGNSDGDLVAHNVVSLLFLNYQEPITISL